MTTLNTRNPRAAPLRSLALALLSGALMAGCASGGAWNFSDSTIPMPVTATGHYGKGIGIPDYSLGNFNGGSSSGWGGGGGSVCCVLVSTDTSKPVMVKVRWKTYRSTVKEERWHEATVPIHFAVPPGKSGGLDVHFLPGHKVELWVSNYGPASTMYPGPKYPKEPGPRYVPLLNEKPELPASDQDNQSIRGEEQS